MVEVRGDRRSSHRDRHTITGLARDVADRDLAVLILRGRDRTADRSNPSERSQRCHSRCCEERG
jgi:hypothetical protein